jgi:hypothetical protein
VSTKEIPGLIERIISTTTNNADGVANVPGDSVSGGIMLTQSVKTEIPANWYGSKDERYSI